MWLPIQYCKYMYVSKRFSEWVKIKVKLKCTDSDKHSNSITEINISNSITVINVQILWPSKTFQMQRLWKIKCKLLLTSQPQSLLWIKVMVYKKVFWKCFTVVGKCVIFAMLWDTTDIQELYSSMHGSFMSYNQKGLVFTRWM